MLHVLKSSIVNIISKIYIFGKDVNQWFDLYLKAGRKMMFFFLKIIEKNTFILPQPSQSD